MPHKKAAGATPPPPTMCFKAVDLKGPLTCLRNTPLRFLPHKSDDSVPSLFPGVLSLAGHTVSHLGHIRKLPRKLSLRRADSSHADGKSLKSRTRRTRRYAERNPRYKRIIAHFYATWQSAGGICPTEFSHRKKKIKCLMYSRV